MDTEIILTKDGSNTIYLPELDETYHSKFGAIQEARHIFIDNGLARSEKLAISVLEIGFGTGLNALLTADYAKKNNSKIIYTAIEKYPLDKEVYSILNYDRQITECEDLFFKIHQVEWERSHELTPYFRLKKANIDILDEQIVLPSGIDLVYFDAFAPSKQPEIWSEEVFARLFKVLNNSGLLVTYSAAGIVKQALRKVGFKVKRLPGPPGKHHMLLAKKG